MIIFRGSHQNHAKVQEEDKIVTKEGWIKILFNDDSIEIEVIQIGEDEEEVRPLLF